MLIINYCFNNLYLRFVKFYRCIYRCICRCSVRCSFSRRYRQHQFNLVNIQFVQQLWLTPVCFFPCSNYFGESRTDILTKANHAKHILNLRISSLGVSASIDGLYRQL